MPSNGGGATIFTTKGFIREGKLDQFTEAVADFVRATKEKDKKKSYFLDSLSPAVYSNLVDKFTQLNRNPLNEIYYSTVIGPKRIALPSGSNADMYFVSISNQYKGENDRIIYSEFKFYISEDGYLAMAGEDGFGSSKGIDCNSHKDPLHISGLVVNMLAEELKLRAERIRTSGQ